MSKSSYLGANVQVNQSFGGWIDKTNQVRHDMGTIVVTVGDVVQPNITNGAETSGNAHVEGIFSATTLSAVDALTGGTVSVPATLDITSNVDFTSTNGTIDITSSINVLTVDANNVIVSSNVVFDGGATKIFLIDAANTVINTGSFYAKSNTYLSGTNTYITSTELKTTSNTIITGATVDIDGTTLDVTSNVVFTATSLNANVGLFTVGFDGDDDLVVNAISDFNANVNIDGILTQTANAVFSGALVNITGANTTVGDAGTDVLNVNATSDFNANVNIDGILTQNANATFSGAETYFDNNVTLGSDTSDTVSILGYVDADVLPSAITVDLGSDANPFGNVHTTYVWSDNNIDTLGDFIVRGSTTRTLKALSTNTGYQTFNLVLETSTANQKLPLVANSTGIHGGANTTYDLGSTAINWNKLYVKDADVANSAVVSNVLTVNSQANTASLMVRDLTATRVPFVSTGGEIVDSANLTFSGSTLAVTGNTTISANLSVTNVVSAANVAATHVGTSTLDTSGLATLASLSVTGTATFNGNVDLQDDDQLLIGTGDDLQLYHDGLNSYIKDAGTGALIVDASAFRVMNAANTETMILASENGAVSLYHDNALRFATSSTGANVTGTFGVSDLATLASANVTSTFRVIGISTLVGNTDFGENVTIAGNLQVSGETTFTSDVQIEINDSLAATSTVSSLFTSSGNTVIGSSTDDIITLNAKVVNDIIPNVNNTYNVGSATAIYDTVYAENLVGNVAWSSVTSKPDPVVTVTLTGDVHGTGSATLTDLASGSMSFATTIQPNSVALDTDTTGNYMSDVTAGGGITVTHTPSANSSATIAHSDTSSAASLTVSQADGNVLQNLTTTIDTYGHVTAISSASTNLDNRYLAFRTFTVTDTDTAFTWTETGDVVAELYNDTITLVSGTDINIDVDATSDAIRVTNTSTLETVTDRGATTTNAISITNTTDASSTSTGALKVSGGVGIAKKLYVGGVASFANTVAVTGATTFANTVAVTGTASFASTVTVGGDLIVNGTTTTLNSSTISVDDKNIELGSGVPKTGLVATLATGTTSVTLTTGNTSGLIPGMTLTKTAGAGNFGAASKIVSITNSTVFVASINHATAGSTTFSTGGTTDVTADGGGITLKGTTDKTFNWVDATDAWTSSEHMNLLTGKAYYINSTSVLNATTLGSGVTSSSLTSVGTLSTGTWSATTIAVNKGGTGQTTYTDGQLLIGNSTGNTLTKSTLTAGSNITITNSAGSITIAAADPATNLGYTSATTQGTVTSSTGTDAIIPAATASIAGLVTTDTQTFAGTKTFSSTISGNISGSAGSAATATYATSAQDLRASSGGLLIIDGAAQSSAVNYLYVRSANTLQDVLMTTAGTDTNIDLLIQTKGTGSITLDTATGAGVIDLKPGSSNLRVWDNTSTHYHEIITGDATANRTLTLPDANVTLVSGTMVPTTGTGATGSWGISVTGSSASCTGNAAQVTNGVYTSGNQTIADTKTFSSNIVAPGISRTGDFTIDASGDIILDADGGQIYLKDAGTQSGYFDVATASTVKLYAGTTLNTTWNNADTTMEGAVFIDNSDGVLDGLKIRNTADEVARFYFDGAGANARFEINYLGSGGSDLSITHNGKVQVNWSTTAIAAYDLQTGANVAYDTFFVGYTGSNTTGSIVLGNNEGAKARLKGADSGSIAIQADPYNDFGSSEITFEVDGTERGSIDASGNLVMTGDITANSDARLKENVVTVDSALDKVSQMRGVYFNKIGEEKRSLGVIAQEIEEVLPEVVLTATDAATDVKGIKSVAYGNIVGVLIEAIKELKAEIEELKKV